MNAYPQKTLFALLCVLLVLGSACSSVPTEQLEPLVPVGEPSSAVPAADGSNVPHQPGLPGTGGPPHIDPAPGRVIIEYRESASDSAMAQSHAAAGAIRVIQTFSEFPNVVVVEVPGGSEGQVISRLLNDSNVLRAEVDYKFQAVLNTPNDPLFDQLWGLRNSGQPIEGNPGTPGADVRALDCWDITTGDPSFRIAVIDTGVDYTHPDLAANIWTNPGEIPGNGRDDDGNGYKDDVHGFDFVSNDGDPMDDHGHGTHCAGTIGAVANNGQGIAGVNWNCKIVPLKCFDANGEGRIAWEVDAINYCIRNGIRLSSNSWGAYRTNNLGILRNVIDNASRMGHVLVAAAGNDSVNNDDSFIATFPATFPLENIISIAATDNTDALTWFSNYGPISVDIAAPGFNVLSTIPGGAYEYKFGTSMATPHVAGAVALLMGRYPELSWQQVRARILQTARPVASLQGLIATGGVLDVAAAIQPSDIPSPQPTAPTPPSNLVASEISPTSCLLTWQDNSTNENDFRLARLDPGEDPSIPADWDPRAILPANTTSFSESGLHPDREYRFRVRARNATGESPWSSVVIVRTPSVPAPNAPSNLRVVQSSQTMVELDWNDNSANEDSFRIARLDAGENADNPNHWDSSGQTTANDTRHVVEGLTPNSTYRFKVRAHGAGGFSDYSNVVETTTDPAPPTAPAAPSNLLACNVWVRTIDICWQDNSNNEVGFKIGMSANGGESWEQTITEPDVTTRRFANLQPGHLYLFRVRAYNNGGHSAFAGPVEVRTHQEVPNAPTELVAIIISGTCVELRWQDNSNNEDGFRIAGSTNDGASWDNLGSTNANDRSFRAQGLVHGRAYCFRVRATNEAGHSDFTNVVCVTTPAPPAAPSNPVIPAVGAHWIDLHWQDNSANEDGFRIAMRVNGQGDFDNVGQTSPNATAIRIGNLSPGTGYCFKVRGFNAEGFSEFSPLACGTTSCEAPAAPGVPAPVVTVMRSIRITWPDHSNNEQGFRIFRLDPGEDSNNLAHWDRIAQVAPNDVMYTDTNLCPATTYGYKVRAFNDCDHSDFSPVLWVSTAQVPAPHHCLATRTANSNQADPIRITWQHDGPTVDGFRISRLDPGEDANNENHWDNVGGDRPADARQYTDSQDLRNGQRYKYRVRAFVNSPCGRKFSDWSNTEDATP